MDCISLDYSLWLTVGQTFLNLFIVGNRVIVCSVSSAVRCDVYLFVQDSTMLFHWSVATLFQYTFVETFTAKFQFIRGNVIATECLTTQTLHLRTSEIFFEEARLSHIMLFVFHTTCSGEEFCYSVSSETIAQSFDRNLCLSILIAGLIQCFSSFSARARYSESVSISNSCLHHQIWWRSFSTAPTFAVLRIEEWTTRQCLALCVQPLASFGEFNHHTMNCS